MMGETTRIEWTDATWNPWMGCSEVSPGCDHCYARIAMERYGHEWRVQRTAKATFYAPLRWKEPRRVFTCSWSDFFHPHVPEEWQQEAWDIMLATPQHTYQVLTKRPGRMAWWAERHGWPDHIWAGTSVESVKYLPRLDVLARVPAKVRFVSAEPLLGLLNLRRWFLGFDDAGHSPDRVEWDGKYGLIACSRCNQMCSPKLDWVIVGGESGPGYRPMHPAWVQNIADQCAVAWVPLFVKQDSGPRPGQQGRLSDKLWALKGFPHD